MTCHDLTPFRIANGDLMIEMPRMAMARFRFARKCAAQGGPDRVRE